MFSFYIFASNSKGGTSVESWMEVEEDEVASRVVGKEGLASTS